ncbi:CU044_5270 family protein [Streptomyces sp. NPDC057199]|uniref:CU044_5270 family protein n=1 Tax=Streptomyces sp. NPDC057199 TaxID=3346047 RepID=UPI003630CB48
MSTIPEKDLPPGRHRVLREHLMREINGETPPEPVRRIWRRPAFVAPALAAALSVAVVLGVAVTRDATESPARPDTGRESAAELLERIARAAGKQPALPPVRDDQFVLVRSEDDYIEATFDDTCPKTDHELTEREIWRSVDGTRWGLDRSDGGEYEERINPKSYGSHDPANYREVERLPTDPDAMYDWLHKGSNPGARTHEAAFRAATEILSDNIVPPKVSAALFRAVAKLPGLTVIQDAEDALGRGGVAIGRTDKELNERTDWIFDEKDLEYLGDRQVSAGKAVSGRCGTLGPGELLTSKAITERAVVDKAGQQP